MFTSIIVGFDGSDAAERALRMGCAIADKFGAKVQVSHTPKDETVVFAADAISGFYIGPNVAQQDALREVAEKMAVHAKEIAASAGHKDITVHIGHGDPADDVLQLAKKEQADLIVTGRRGLGNLSGLILGSKSQSIGKNATCACLTVV